MAWYKEYAGKACNWFVCISHILELPLRRVAKLMMGETSGPNGFKSELGKKIQDLHVIPTPVKFEAIPCEEFPNPHPPESRKFGNRMKYDLKS